jgi:hypothetical protein
MDNLRVVVREARECCEFFVDKYDQPTQLIIDAFSTAASYAEYADQAKELRAILDQTDACDHVKEAATATHKSLCGNEAHVALENHAWFCGVSTEEFEAIMGTP